MRRTASLAAAALVAALALTACDAAGDVANDAACSVARSAVDEAGRQASNAVDDIGADPAAAERELRGIRDALAAAQKGVDGDVEAKLVEVKSAVEDLLGQAQDAAQGAEVDTTAVEGARDDLDSAVEDVKNFC